MEGSESLCSLSLSTITMIMRSGVGCFFFNLFVSCSGRRETKLG